ncbi:O-succinylhomoserine sulfhydrylase [Rhodococcus aerolatus]
MSRRELRPDTLAVRGGLDRTGFEENSEALFLTSGFVYGSAADAEAAFAGDVDRFVYSRYGNPTVAVFEERLRLLEGTEDCFATASGMSAVWTALASLVRAGDRIVAARSLFGSCFAILNEILPRYGVTTEFVDGTDLAQWERALATPAAAVFFETPSNPMQEVVDIAAVAALAHAAGAQVVLDNVFATPVLQRATDLGVDVVVYSATKHIDGQGRVLGGAVLGRRELIRGQVEEMMRHTGPAMSPFSAWVLLKGLETMAMRVRHACAGALELGRWLEQQDEVAWVRHPFLDSHPQVELARSQMSGGGTVLTFALGGPGAGRDRAFEVLDRLEVIDISNNLGDAKSLITHPATTTHRKLGAEGRAAIGLTDAVVRLSVGLEDVEDLREDLATALQR